MSAPELEALRDAVAYRDGLNRWALDSEFRRADEAIIAAARALLAAEPTPTPRVGDRVVVGHDNPDLWAGRVAEVKVSARVVYERPGRVAGWEDEDWWPLDRLTVLGPAGDQPDEEGQP